MTGSSQSDRYINISLAAYRTGGGVRSGKAFRIQESGRGKIDNGEVKRCLHALASMSTTPASLVNSNFISKPQTVTTTSLASEMNTLVSCKDFCSNQAQPL